MRPSLFALGLAWAMCGCSEHPEQPQYWQRAWTKAAGSEAKLLMLDEARNSGHVNVATPVLHDALEAEANPRVKVELSRLLIRNQNAAVALDALDVLVRANSHDTFASLLPAAMEESTLPVVVKRSIEVFGDRGRSEAVPFLVESLVHEYRGRSFLPESSFALFQLGKPAADALVSVLNRESSPALAWARAHGAEAMLLAASAELLGDLGESRAEEPLIALLSFEHTDRALMISVRKRAAYALGRLRSAAGLPRLITMLNESNVAARGQCAQAVGEIGGRTALVALAQLTAAGEWAGREVAIAGLTMLGDGREIRAFEEMIESDEKLIRATCREHSNYDGCDDADQTVQKQARLFRAYGKRLEAAKLCKQSAQCWSQKLDDPETRVRERAALELGKLGDSSQVDALFAHLDDRDPQVQLVITQSLHWLLKTGGEARERARRHLPDLKRRIAEGRGKIQFARLNQPLRRLAFQLRGSTGS